MVDPIPIHVLGSWSTKRLLALRHRLLRCEPSLELSDIQHPFDIDPAPIRFKDDPRWRKLYDATLEVLSTREHVPGGAERKLRRQTDLATARSGDRPPRPKRGSP